MKILVLYNKDSGCCYHRSYLPISCLQMRDGDQTIFKEYRDVLIDSDFEVDIVYYNRIIIIPLNRLKALKKKYGFKVVCDIDDSWELYPHHYLTVTYTRDRIPEHIVENMKNADLVTCTNKNLQLDITTYNSNCEVIPNALPFDIFQFNAIRIPSQEVRIIFAGGPSHYYDLKTIQPVFFELSNCKELIGKYSFNVAGYEETPIWRSIMGLLGKNPVNKNRYMPVTEYMNQYMFADISIAPLEANLFNTRKSNLKIIEAGCKGIPIVCSAQDPYSDETPGVIRCNNTHDWIKHLKCLIKDPVKRSELGMLLNHYVRQNYDLVKVNKLRYDILQNLIKS